MIAFLLATAEAAEGGELTGWPLAAVLVAAIAGAAYILGRLFR